MTTQDSDTPMHRVLLVDDNPTNLQVLYETLQDLGLQLLVARSGEQALEIAGKARPSLILLDIMMPPGIDGYETCRRLKADPVTRDAGIIFLSALEDTADKVKAFEAGGSDYVPKPFEAAEVIARVQTQLKIIQLQADLTARNEELAGRNRELQEAAGRIRKDLDAAAKVQRGLLPKAEPECQGYSFSWQYYPCTALGGDALDIYRIDNEHVAFYLLDVSGHGVPAALLAVTACRSLAPRADRSSLVVEPGWDSGSFSAVRPAEVLRRLNLVFPMDHRNPQYMTMIYGLLKVSTGEVRYACGGHPGPILARSDGTVESIDGGSRPVGMFADTTYEEKVLTLGPGDRLFLHSDGLYEQTNGDEDFGRQRLREMLARPAGDFDELLQGAVSAVRDWCGGQEVDDDLSVLGVARHTGDA